MSTKERGSSRTRGVTSSPSRPKPAKRQSITGHDPLHSRRSTHGVLTTHVTSDVRVEQLPDRDVISGSAVNQSGERSQPDKQQQRLELPETEANESSDGSSMVSPRSDDGGQFPEEDESIAVNCHTNPSEVIVKGKNVKQIRVKFPPHPPPSDDFPRKSSARGRLKRNQSSYETTATPNDEKLPFPCEETSLPAINETPHDVRSANFSLFNRQESGISLHSNDHVYNQFINGSAATSSRIPEIDWNLKYKQDILAGLDFFEKRGLEFNELNNRAAQEIAVLKRKNEDLEEQVYKLQKTNACIMDDVSELKIKLDQAEKEAQIRQDQTMSQWHERIALEEQFTDLQRDKTHEINSLKDKLLEKDKEVAILTAANNSEALKKKDGLLKDSKKTTLSDDNFELMLTISKLQDEIKKLNFDKDNITDKNGRLRQDVADLKTALADKSHELNSQCKRFLALKKSYNDLDDEHKKLKVQLRGRSMSQLNLGMPGHRDQAAANTTWPATAPAPAISKPGLSKVELETVSYIDFPKTHQASKALGSQQKQARLGNAKAGKAKHARTKSEVTNLCDNLPPVPNPSR